MDKESRDRTIDPHENCSCGLEAPAEPLYFLYFEDAHFISPHYQSIRPKSAPIVPDITISPPTPIFESTNIFSEKVIQIFIEHHFYNEIFLLRYILLGFFH